MVFLALKHHSFCCANTCQQNLYWKGNGLIKSTQAKAGVSCVRLCVCLRAFACVRLCVCAFMHVFFFPKTCLFSQGAGRERKRKAPDPFLEGNATFWRLYTQHLNISKLAKPQSAICYAPGGT